MQITMRPMTVDEAWEGIVNDYVLFHTVLKKYDYNYDSFIPNHPIIKEMFSVETHNRKSAEKYEKFFKQEIYNIDVLTKYCDIFKSYLIPTMERKINDVLVPLLKSWNAHLPDELEILFTYGRGARYLPPFENKFRIIFRVSEYPNNKVAMLGTILHEFVHILIENQIIRKYNVPQNFKERIVEIICQELFNKPVRQRFINLFLDKYITPETIKTDLPGAVQKMMTDYIILQQKQNSMVQKQ
jgi:hypothetical protein